MTKQHKRELKFFTVPQWQEEQDYLRRRHREGWRFTGLHGLVYHFESCIPEDVVYQLDFNPEGRAHKAEYIQMFQDCGWEYLQDAFGYSYFRKPTAAMTGGEEEIFCDDASRLDMMRRVLNARILPLLCFFLCIILPQIFIQSHINGAANQFLSGFFTAMAVLYLALFLRFALQYWALRRS